MGAIFIMELRIILNILNLNNSNMKLQVCRSEVPNFSYIETEPPAAIKNK